MSVDFLISRRNGQPNIFDKPFENLAMHRVAKLMWQRFHDTDQRFLIIFNVQDPPMDMVIVSEYGMGVLDFKNFSDDVEGSPESEWYFVDSKGRPIKAIEAGANHINPFQQVKQYREKFEQKLNNQIHVFRSMKNVIFGKPGCYLQGCVVPTGKRIDLRRIEMSKYHSWFTIQWPEDIPVWADALTFGGLELKLRELIPAIRVALNVEEYSEIEKHLTHREVYGILWITEDGKDLASYQLDQEQVTIGRASDNLICLPQYNAVSGHHAVIQYAVDGNVYIYDNGSTNGTSVNDISINQTAFELKSGDHIVLGKQLDGQPAEGSCKLVFRRSMPGRNTTRYQGRS